jgi:SAM-dependent methyltransferase
LDVGGWDFFETARRKSWTFDHWTILEPDPRRVKPHSDDSVASDVSIVQGDGCAMQFPDESFDTVLNIQVLEHVFEPNHMMKEMARVLRSGGRMVIVVPQTANVHLAPHNYYNFTKYWIRESATRLNLEVEVLEPQGGFWSSIASRLVYFFPQSMGLAHMSSPEDERSAWFYLLFPFMVLFAIVSIPICMLLSVGDLSEEPNNHFVIFRKPPPRA